MTWNTWCPNRILRVDRVLNSSMNPVVLQTDLGQGYMKALGNRQGEHALACELIGTSLAQMLGLETLDYSLIEHTGEPVVHLDVDPEQQPKSGRCALPGPAFITKAIDANQWDGSEEALRRVVNRKDLAGLVLLDTWIGNPDRHPRRPPETNFPHRTKQNLDNVLLATEPKNKLRLVAMDFSVCLYCRDGGLRSRYEDRFVHDDGIYGMFAEFEPFVTEKNLRPFLDRLANPTRLRPHVVEALDRVPNQWMVDRTTRQGVTDFLCARAGWLVDNFPQSVQSLLTPPST